ncbi:MAG TPA: ABC transporter permease [bacterium]|nr:ABC transporter permease [bacterium]
MAHALRSVASTSTAPAVRSRWRGFGRALRRNIPALLSLVFIGLLVVVAVFAPLLAPYGPSIISASASFRAPTWQHPFGTDLFGRDILSRVIYGTRLSLLVGVLAVAIGAAGGTLLGMLAGISGRRGEQAIMRCIDVALAFPFILLAILILAFFGQGVQNVMLAVGIAYVPRFARITHASTLSLREMEFVSAARASGAGLGRVMLRHILPNLFQVLTVYGTFSIPVAILIEAGLDYLGLGVRPPTPTWGAIINEGRQSLLMAPWESVLPGLVIMLAVLAFNLFGEAVANFLDPKANIGLNG